MVFCCCESEISIEGVKNLIEIFSLLAAIIAAIFIYFPYRIAPIILLDIQHDWVDKSTGQLLLTIRVENKSKVKVKKVDFLLHILQYNSDRLNLSEWVPLPTPSSFDNPNEVPDVMSDPIKFMKSTKYIYPGEFTTMNYLTSCPVGKLIHILLQFKSQFWFYKKESWAITRIIVNK